MTRSRLIPTALALLLAVAASVGTLGSTAIAQGTPGLDESLH